jgi:alkanesulfonate monooxygenase SsuD/methylene tetrahydromethanopterin reductase-like flavin-dependent oxidoreductase (luciferase family)
MPSPQGRPVLIQAGGSPRGVKASAYFADHVFGASKPLKLQAQQRVELDTALRAQGRDPESVGILWDVLVVVGETSQAAKLHKERLLTAIPPEAAGAFLSHYAGFDFSTLPDRFTLGEVNAAIAAKQASPAGFVHQLAFTIGKDTPISRREFFEHGLRDATGYEHTIAGSAEEVADKFEEVFEATGSRGGFMIAHPQSTPRDLVNIVDFLVPELRRRGRFRTQYTGKTLRENLST